MRASDQVEPLEQTVLADDWGSLTRYRFRLKRRDGEWQEQTREAYDRGDGVACLLRDPVADTVLLTRQFRLPVHVAGDGGYLVEVPAGLLDGDDAEEQMRKELEEETGYRVSAVTRLFDLYSSPGSVTERIVFFTGIYSASDRIGAGGGNPHEGEDIEVLHVPFAEAMAMIGSGEMRDAKTVLLLQHLAIARGREG